MTLKLAFASDHGGFDLKQTLISAVSGDEIEIIDLGVHNTDSMDYPDKAHEIAEAVLSGKADRGVLVCGTGIGVSIAANRHKGIRAALCTDPHMAAMSREHNDANILCLGGRVIGPGLAEAIVQAFLTGTFEGDRHVRRLEKIELK